MDDRAVDYRQFLSQLKKHCPDAGHGHTHRSINDGFTILYREAHDVDLLCQVFPDNIFHGKNRDYQLTFVDGSNAVAHSAP